MPYLDQLIARIKNRDQWPDFDRPHYLAELNTIADDAYDSGTTHGHLAALLIYHQLTEEILRLLLQYSEFLVQLRLAPIEIHFPIPEKAMFGRLLEAVRASMEFEHKKEILKLAQAINQGRVELVHSLTKQENAAAISQKTKQVKEKFEDFFKLFSDSQDWFLVCLKDMRKDTDWDELLADERGKKGGE